MCSVLLQTGVDIRGGLAPPHYTPGTCLSCVSHLTLVILRTGILGSFSVDLPEPNTQ